MNKVSTLREQRRAGLVGSRLLASSLSVLVSLLLTACKVEWGGVQVEAGEPHYERPAATEASGDTVSERLEVALPSGPLLFHVLREGVAGDATIEPVAELTSEGLKLVGPQRAEHADEYVSRFLDRYYGVDQAYVLFRAGSRVGTFYTRAPAVSGSGLCLRLSAEGIVELRPAADTMSEFYAWRAGTRSGADSIAAPAYRDDMRAMAQVLARQGVFNLRRTSGRSMSARVNSVLPPHSWCAIRWARVLRRTRRAWPFWSRITHAQWATFRCSSMPPGTDRVRSGRCVGSTRST
jgi:hypothetical protein